MSGHSEPLILVVDENDTPIGAASKQEIWQKGLWHRIVRIMVEDVEGNILLQKRADTLQLYPGRWDDSAAGHVDEGEDYDDAANREMAEEIGLENVKLEDFGEYKCQIKFEWRTMNRYTKVYRIIVDPQTAEFKTNPEEVSELKWFTLAEAKALVKNQPDHVTDGLRDVIEKFY